MKPNLDVQLHILTILENKTTAEPLYLDELLLEDVNICQLSYDVGMLRDKGLIRAKVGLQGDDEDYTSFLIEGLTSDGHEYLAKLREKAPLFSLGGGLLSRVVVGITGEFEKQFYKWAVKFIVVSALLMMAYVIGLSGGVGP
mgnify:CR=1 FL=1